MVILDGWFRVKDHHNLKRPTSFSEGHMEAALSGQVDGTTKREGSFRKRVNYASPCSEMQLPRLCSSIGQPQQRSIRMPLREVTRVPLTRAVTPNLNLFLRAKDTLPVTERSCGPRNIQCLHNTFGSRNVVSTIIEDSSNDGLHSIGHRARVDRVALGSVLKDTFCKAFGEALLREIRIGRSFGYNVANLAYKRDR